MIHETRIFILVRIAVIWCLLFPTLLRSASARELIDRIVAEVNDDIILYSELDDEITPFKSKILTENFAPAKEKMLLQRLREDMLDRLIEARLTDQEVKRLNITINEAEIDSAIQNIRETGGVSEADFKLILEKQGITPEDYRERIRNQILRNKLVNIQVKSKIVVTQQDIEACYIREKDKYCGKKKYHLKNIFMKTPWPGSTEQKEDAGKQMAAVFEKLKAGESFDALLRQYSQTQYALSGGYLGAFEEETLSEHIRNAVGPLKEGEFTDVLESDQGYQILLLEKVEITAEKSLQEASSEIEKRLYDEIVDQKFQDWLKELRKNSHIRILLNGNSQDILHGSFRRTADPE
jgi:peptidyl-prolyl cis-trans isomerase SurA